LTVAPEAEARRRRAEGATLAELARSYHVGKSTISRLTAWTHSGETTEGARHMEDEDAKAHKPLSTNRQVYL
jgi:hypothetical protein